MIELLAITPDEPASATASVEAWIDAGIDRCSFAVLVRRAGATPEETLGVHAGVINACLRRGIPLLLSTSVDALPAASDAVLREGFAGVHLRGDPSPAELGQARSRFGDALLIGRSCHGAPQVGDRFVDYTCLAPVFAPRTTTAWAKAPSGVAALTPWCTPERWIVALGGITPATAPACLAAGARGLASIATFLGPPKEVAENVGYLVELVVSARHVSSA